MKDNGKWNAGAAGKFPQLLLSFGYELILTRK